MSAGAGISDCGVQSSGEHLVPLGGDTDTVSGHRVYTYYFEKGGQCGSRGTVKSRFFREWEYWFS
jgi:hypothetical protein